MTRFVPIEVERFEKSALFDLVNLNCLPITGFGNVYNHVDLQWDMIIPGAFKRSISEYKAAGKFPKMFKEHDKNDVCGEWTRVEEDDFGIKLCGSVTDKELITDIVSQQVTGLSIGFSVANDAYEYKRDYVYNALKGKKEYKWIKIIKECDLIEISIVMHPANSHSRFHVATSAEING